ncbi:MAG: PPC domain-containing protein [Acidobacteria bacterium]|nr:PPC domain-containing protein [Acidobacteriota bacterium]
MLVRSLLVFAATWVACAEPLHMVEYVYPRGGSRGATVQVTFNGRYLRDPRAVIFYRPGIHVTELHPGDKPEETVKAKFEIAADCPLGEHVLRLRTATGLSDAVTFWVSPFPKLPEFEKKAGEDDTLATAQRVPLNVTIDGHIDPGNRMDVDYYAVAVKQDDRLSVEVESVRLGTLHQGFGDNDLLARILDSAGKELARGGDNSLLVQDPVLSIVAPRTGVYFVEVKQEMYQAPRNTYYRVHIGNFVRPMLTFPLGGEAGKPLHVRIYGDPAGDRTETVQLPSKPGDFEYFLGQVPSPNMLRVSPYPNVIKSDEGITVAPAIPVAFNGIYNKGAAADVFQFPAKKGESWKVRVIARTGGSPMDPRFWIRSTKSQKNIVAADDSRMNDLGYVSNRGTWHIKDTLDPVAIFKPPADGDYLVGIEDTRGKSGPDFAYRIEIEPVRDTVYTHITSSDAYQMPKTTGMIVPQGGRWTMAVQLAAGLGNTFQGDIELEAKGLPRGVKMIAQKYPKGVTRMPVQFEAEPGAEQQAAWIELLARPADRIRTIHSESRQAFHLFNRPGERPWHYVFLNKYALAVTDPAPFYVELEKPATPLTRSGEMMLRLKVVRHGEFQGPVEIFSDWLPSGVSSGGTLQVPAGKSEALYRIQANDKAATGKFPIALNATTTTGGDANSGIGRIRVSTPFTPLEVAEPYISIQLKRAAVERGGTAEILALVKHNRPFPGKATLELRRLPKGVEMAGPAPIIRSRDLEIVIPVKASADALAGLYKDIFCEVTITENGQTVKQQTGSGVLRIDMPRTASAVSAQ